MSRDVSPETGYNAAGTGTEGRKPSLTGEERDLLTVSDMLRREMKIADMFGGSFLGNRNKLTLDDIGEEFRGDLIFRELEGEPYKLRQLQKYIDEEVVPSCANPYEATSYSQLEYFVRKYTEYEELSEDTRTLIVATRFRTKSREILPVVSKKETQGLLARAIRHELAMSAQDDTSEARMSRIEAMLECVDDNDTSLDVIDACYENGAHRLGNEVSRRLEDKLESSKSEYWLAGLYAAQLKHGIEVYRNIDNINALFGGDISGIASDATTKNRRRLIAEGLSRNSQDYNVQAMLERVKSADEESYYFVMSTLPAEQYDSATRRKLKKHAKGAAKRWADSETSGYSHMGPEKRREALDTLTRYMGSGLGEFALKPLATFVENTDYVVDKANKATVAALRSGNRYHDGLLVRGDDEFAEEYLSRDGVHPKVRRHYSAQMLDGIKKETIRTASGRTHRFNPNLPYVGIMKAALRRGEDADVLAAYNWLDQHDILRRREIFEIGFSISEHGIAEADDAFEEDISFIKAKLEVLDVHLSRMNLTNGTVEKKKNSNIVVKETEDSIERAIEIPNAGQRFIALSVIADLYVKHSVPIPRELKRPLSEAARLIANTDEARRPQTVVDVQQSLEEYKTSGLW